MSIDDNAVEAIKQMEPPKDKEGKVRAEPLMPRLCSFVQKQHHCSRASPAELLNRRRYRTSLPIKNRTSPNNRSHRKRMEAMHKKREDRYNQRAKAYSDLQQYEPVYGQVEPEPPKWQQATVTRTPTEDEPLLLLILANVGMRGDQAVFKRNKSLFVDTSLDS
ncbi:hypothetical protein CAPTEDRAFT_217102 [Capitella teleta]|uniref:Uncharacterized protein n=1 Tax=Capitella teleta TaxID=283909 RepID=R7TN02_CAPTE|nr:hypothetical protein CAPTEDRAFT_217102 [Capitella teleta]|eukprot:ELT92460.1 hypothetical protein CAPTEDRAFT_217102 [Capitella teleta]